MIRLALGSVALILTSGWMHAQVVEVPGTYADLQAAIDGSAPGTTIVVHGGVWSALTIPKSLTIVGDPAPEIQAIGNGSYFLPAISLNGPGSGSVVLARIHTSGTVEGFVYGTAAPAIYGGGFDELEIFDSEIHAPEWCCLTGLGMGKPGISVTVPFVLVERSLVTGARTDIDSTYLSSGWNGPAGISAPASTVTVLDSRVRGGDSGLFTYYSDLCDFGCPGGTGGPGVQCDTLFHAGSSLVAGAGAVWRTRFGQFCCQVPTGPAVVASSTVDLGSALVAAQPMRLGREFELTLASTGPAAELDFSFGLNPPVNVAGLGWRFLRPGTTSSLGVFASPGSVTLRFPPDATLIGALACLQLLDPTDGYSRPVAGVLLPARSDKQATPTRTVTRVH